MCSLSATVSFCMRQDGIIRSLAEVERLLFPVGSEVVLVGRGLLLSFRVAEVGVYMGAWSG